MAIEFKLMPAPRLTQLRFTLASGFLAVTAIAAVSAWFVEHRHRRALDAIVAAHSLRDSEQGLKADQYRVFVRKLTIGPTPAIYEIVIETLGEAEVTVDSASSQSIVTSGYGVGAVLIRSAVVVSADLIEAGDDSARLQVLVQPVMSGGGGAGGPSTYTVPKGKKIEELFSLEIKPGVYERGKLRPLCTVDGQAYTLAVK